MAAFPASGSWLKGDLGDCFSPPQYLKQIVPKLKGVSMFVNDYTHKEKSRIQTLVRRKGMGLVGVQVIKSKQKVKILIKKEDTISYLDKLKIYVVLSRIKGWSSNSIYLWVVTLPFHCASLCFWSKNKQ